MPFPSSARRYVQPFWTIPYVMMCVLTAILLSVPQVSKAATEQELLVDKARITLEGFLNDPDMDWFREHLKDIRGIVIVPQFIKGAFFIGGSGGSGILLARDEKSQAWSQPAFVILGGASIGLQIGGQASELILLVFTQKGVDSMVSTTLKLGADASVAVGPIGRGIEGSTAANLSADLLSFTKTKGLFAGMSVEGATVAARDSWNTAYYNQQTKAMDVLVRRNVTNPHSQNLLSVLEKATQHQ